MELSEPILAQDPREIHPCYYIYRHHQLRILVHRANSPKNQTSLIPPTNGVLVGDNLLDINVVLDCTSLVPRGRERQKILAAKYLALNLEHKVREILAHTTSLAKIAGHFV